MKLFFISDIHGSLHYLKIAIECYHRENANNIILLGDALYHGPRNPLPKDYNPQEVAKLLNEYGNRIIAVRGNCDSEVDQMLIEYPMMSDYSIVLHENRRIFLTHGHLHNPENLPRLCEGDVFAYGHTHISLLEKKEGIYVINPGSVSLPKDNNPNSYGILENNLFLIKDLNGNVLHKLSLNK
jgi:uncharacterized protein